METAYPLDGAVEVSVVETGDAAWTLALRIPDWCRGATASVNGSPVDAAAGPKGYLEIHRAWRAGDRVALTLPMPVRITMAHPSVDAVRGAVAVERGPVVYCFESPDQPEGVDLNRTELLLDPAPAAELREDFLGQQVVVVTARGIARDDAGWGGAGWATLTEAPAPAGREVPLTAIPYHLWANRGPSVMRIFIPVWRG
jgi:DUF1680 family protein